MTISPQVAAPASYGDAHRIWHVDPMPVELACPLPEQATQQLSS
jgi:hypothetical protein